MLKRTGSVAFDDGSDEDAVHETGNRENAQEEGLARESFRARLRRKVMPDRRAKGHDAAPLEDESVSLRRRTLDLSNTYGSDGIAPLETAVVPPETSSALASAPRIVAEEDDGSAPMDDLDLGQPSITATALVSSPSADDNLVAEHRSRVGDDVELSDAILDVSEPQASVATCASAEANQIIDESVDAFVAASPNVAASPKPSTRPLLHAQLATSSREADFDSMLNGEPCLEESASSMLPNLSLSSADASPEVGPVGHVISISGSVVWGDVVADAVMPVEMGAIVRLEGGAGRSFGVITALKRDGRRQIDDRRLIEIRLLGEIPHGSEGFQCGISQHPSFDAAIFIATRTELETIFKQPEVATIRLGTLRQADDLPAYAITDNMLGKHFAVLGTTGAGKSCAVSVILRAVLKANPYGHILMLDPHNEYGHAFADCAERLNPETLRLPYWLLNFEEIAEVLVNKDSPERAYAEGAILREAILQARRLACGKGANTDHLTIDTPSPYRLSDLVRVIKDMMGAFNKAESTAPYQHLIARIEAIAGDRRYDFMFSSFMVQDSMADVLAQLLRIPVGDKPLTIIDLSGMPSEIVDVAVSVLCRLMFEFALWSERGEAPPTLLVCEEAHRYVPQDETTGFGPTKRAISRIAKEGRKYGLSLCLVTQRPAELSVSSLSQCNTIFALRMGNEHDLNFVQHAIPESSSWLTDAMPSLNTREAVVIGAGVNVPMHIRFDELPPAFRPASTTPTFSDAWQADHGDRELIEDTIERWRHQRRGDGRSGSA